MSDWRDAFVPEPGGDWPPLEAAPIFVTETAPEIMALAEPDENGDLLGPLVRASARTIIVGDTGHGKTSLALAMLAAVLSGETLLEHTGAGRGPALVVDLEQGLRSIKRGLREARLDDRTDLHYLRVPDGLALDRDLAQLAALEATLADLMPSVVLLDPYYKAHRADDPNAERPIIDLFRQLDGLRARYGFALILPAHPRKEAAGSVGARKLTIHDVAGSGAATRGAEIVIGLERLGHGFGRLRYLKDRDGDLPVGEAVTLVYSKEDGFRLDPREQSSEAEIERAVLAKPRGWMTVSEWARELGVRDGSVRGVLKSLAAPERGEVAFLVGAVGQNRQAHCYGTSPECFERVRELQSDIFSEGRPEIPADPRPSGRPPEARGGSAGRPALPLGRGSNGPTPPSAPGRAEPRPDGFDEGTF
jgi:hypothetical protein